MIDNKLKSLIIITVILLLSTCSGGKLDKENSLSNVNANTKLSHSIKEKIKRASADYKRTGRYKFPIKPGSSLWKKLTTKRQMIEVTQIPTTIKESLSSEELLTLITNHPLVLDHFAYNDIEAGFSSFIASFNGANEFLKHPNAAKVLLERYTQFRVSKIENTETIAGDLISKPVFKMGVLELLLSQDSILDNLKSNNIFGKLIMDTARLKLKQNHFHKYGLTTSKILLTNYLRKTQPQFSILEMKKQLSSIDESVKWLISLIENK